MQGIAWFLLTIFLLSVLSFKRCKPYIWFSVVIIYLSLLTVFSSINIFLLLFFWFIFVSVTLVTCISSLPKILLSQPLFKYLQKNLPYLSETEKIAIATGSCGWEKDLLFGFPDFNQLNAVAEEELTEEEKAFIDQQVNQLCSMLDSWRIYQDKDLSKKVWQFLKKEKFFGLMIPKEFDGLEFSPTAYSHIIAKIASRNDSVAVTAMVPNSLGPAELLLRYGTEEQKKYYLPKLATGRMIPCFALTSLEAGSDASAITDIGIISYGDWHGERVLGLNLTWDKRYITLAPVADLLGLAIKVLDPDQLVGQNSYIGITLCLIPTNHPGVQIGHRHRPLAASFMNGPSQGEHVFIPLEWVIGGQEKLGCGWQMLMECLSNGRGISLPSMMSGIAMLACRTTSAYAKIRKQFNVSIGHFSGIEALLSRMFGLTCLIEAVRAFTISAVQQGLSPTIASAISKYQTTEMAREVVRCAMDIHGGKAIQLGEKNYLGVFAMNAAIGITVEGANVLTRNLIIFGQGVMQCHPFLLEEWKSIQESNIARFNHLLIQHLGHVSKLFLSHFLLTITQAKIVRFGSASTRIYYQQLMRMSQAFALTTEFALLYLGDKLKKQERLSARLADIWSFLYLASAVLKWYASLNSPNEQLVLVRWTMKFCFYQIQNAFDEFFNNFPARFSAWILKKWIFPLGQIYYPPSDQQEHEMVEKMLEPGFLRDTLTSHCFISNYPEDAVKQLEITFNKMVKAEHVYKKLRQAVLEGKLAKGSFMMQLEEAKKLDLLNETEVAAMIDLDYWQNQVLAVDEFS